MMLIRLAISFGLGMGLLQPHAQVSAQTTIIRIGHTGPLTGQNSFLGQENENGVRLAIEQANAARIQIAGSTAVFELVAEDDRNNMEEVERVANRLVAARVSGVVGHLLSRASSIGGGIYSKQRIPMISPSAGHPALTQERLQTVFRVMTDEHRQAQIFGAYLAASLKPKLVSLVDDGTTYGRRTADAIEKSLAGRGVRTLPRERGSDTTTDWKAILAKVKADGPDLIVFGGDDETAALFLSQGRELGIPATFALAESACLPSMHKSMTDGGSRAICGQLGIPASAASRTFLDAYRKRFNRDPIVFAHYAFDAANLLIAAIREAGSADPQAFLLHLRNLSQTGASGAIRFDEEGDRETPQSTVFEITRAELRPVAVIEGTRTTTFEEYLRAASGR